jgi:hypothetical protein
MTRSDRLILPPIPTCSALGISRNPNSRQMWRPDYAKLLSGRYLNAAGVMLALKPEDLAEVDRSLHQRAPHLFE